MSWYFLDGQPELPLRNSCEKREAYHNVVKVAVQEVETF
jgi:hypothetical protein